MVPVASPRAALPNGLNLNGTTGAITGTPTATGVFNFTCFVSGSNRPRGPQNPAARHGIPAQSGTPLGLAGTGLFRVRQLRRA